MKKPTRKNVSSVIVTDKHIQLIGLLSADSVQKNGSEHNSSEAWKSQAQRVFEKLSNLAAAFKFAPQQIVGMTIMFRGAEKEYQEYVKIYFNFFFRGINRPPTAVLSAVALPNSSLIAMDVIVRKKSGAAS